MTNTSVAHELRRTTRDFRVDGDFLNLLEQDFGISMFSLLRAFDGIPPAPKKEAIALCEWATRTAGGDVDEAGRALLAWAKKYRRGRYAPGLADAPAVTYGEGV